jgi:hypothetical protein
MTDILIADGVRSTSELRTKAQDGKDLYIGAGWVLFGLKGTSNINWSYRDLHFDVGPYWLDPPKMLPTGGRVTLVTPTLGLASVMSSGADNAGWAVDDCDVAQSQPQDLSSYRVKIVCQVGVRDVKAIMYRLSYHIAMLGRLAG